MSRRFIARAVNALLWLALVVEVTLLVAAISAGRADADIIGSRIEARACQGPVLCADLPTSKRLWGGRYACQGRAENLREMASDMPPKALRLLKGAYTFTVRCRPVEGMPGA